MRRPIVPNVQRTGRSEGYPYIITGVIVDTRAGAQNCRVRLDNQGRRVIKNVIIPRGVDLQSGDRVLLANLHHDARWTIVTRIEEGADIGQSLSPTGQGSTQLHPPNNFAVAGVVGAVRAEWDCWAGNTICWEVQHNSSASASGASTRYTRGAYWFYHSSAPATRYFRVRAVRYNVHRDVAHYSSWTSWTSATSLSASDADTVDGFHASSTPVANWLLALDSNAQFPSSVVPSTVIDLVRDFGSEGLQTDLIDESTVDAGITIPVPISVKDAASPSSSYAIQAKNEIASGISGSVYGLRSEASIATPSTPHSISAYGMTFNANITTATVQSSGSLAGLIGYSNIANTIAATVNNMYGGYLYTDVEDGSASNAAAVRAITPFVDGGSLTTGYGLWITQGTVGVGSISTLYGIYIAAITAGSTSYAMYSAGGDSYHAGQFDIEGGVKTDTIVEHTSAAGVTIDTALIKDGYFLGSLPGAKASVSADPIGTGAVEAMVFDTEDWDTSGYWVAGSPTRMTIPTGLGGRYMVTGYAFADAAAIYTNFYVQVRKGGSTVLFQSRERNDVSYRVALSIAGEVALAATDYIELLIFQQSGSDANFTGYLSLTRVGA